MKIITKIKTSKVAKNTIIYTLFSFINKGIPFLLLPIITRYLSQEDYGTISIFNTYVQFLVLFVGLSLNSAISVNYFHLSKDEFKEYLGNSFYILSFMTIIVFLAVFIFKSVIHERITLPYEWLYISIVVALMSMISQFNLTIWRVQQEAKPFAIYETVMTLLNIVVSLVLIIAFNLHWLGRVWGIASVTILFGFISMVFIIKRGYLDLTFNKNYIKDALKLGISILPHYFAQWMRTGVDIFLITFLVGLQYTGVYALGYQFGAIVGILAGAFNTAYASYQMEKLKSINQLGKIKLVKFAYKYFIGIFIFSILFGLSMKLLFPIMIDSKFSSAVEYIVIIAIAYSFQGMYFMVVNYIYFEKKNHLVSLATIVSTVIQIILSYFMIQEFGAIGAAYATLVGFVLNFLIVWYIGSKVYPMPWGFWYEKNS